MVLALAKEIQLRKKEFENDFQFLIMVVVFGQLQFVELQKFHFLVDNFYQSKTHNGRSRVDS